MTNILPQSNSLSNFGGIKTDYSQIVSVATDWSADNVNSAFGDVAAMSRTAIRTFAQFITSATAPTLVNFDAVWKTNTPTLPVIVRTGAGIFTVTYPASVTDELGNAQSLNLRSGVGNISSTSTFGFCNVVVSSSNVLTIYLANVAGSANDLVGVTIQVYAV